MNATSAKSKATGDLEPSATRADRAGPGKLTPLGRSSADDDGSSQVIQRSAVPSAASVGDRMPDWHADDGLLAALGLGGSATNAAPLQRLASDATALGGERATDVGARGVSGASSSLPHGEAIQRSFGRHDVSGIAAHVGGDASVASKALGAEAYATGHHVAFSGAPSLHTAAHEAAHVVQQRAGLSLKGGLGEAGDPHERHADAVAEQVVRGESAESLLDQYGESSASLTGAAPVQRMSLDEETHVARSDNGKMVVVGQRKQCLYATASLIDKTNQIMETAKARIRLTQGPAWDGGEDLYLVIPEVVDDKKLDQGVSDKTIGPVLKQLEPVHGESDEQRDEKARKYRAFWKNQETRMFNVSIEISKFQNRKYVSRMNEEPPRRAPGFTPQELRGCVVEQMEGASGDYHGKFFQTMIRNLLEEYDAKVGKLQEEAVSPELLKKQLLENRVKSRDESDDLGFEEEEDFYTDAVKHPPTPLERLGARDAAYQGLHAQGERSEDSYTAAKFLSDKIYATIDLIGEEIDSDGSTLIGPKRCSDMTRFIYGGQDLDQLPHDQAGGQVLHAEQVDGIGRIFHSAGVIMEDGDDMVTLEAANGSGALPVGRNTWWFQMYGKKGEMTFAKQTAKRWESIA